MPTLTPNYSFNLPLVNNPTDQDLWGGYLNANFSSIDSILAGSATTGDFIWSQATTKAGWLICYGQAISRITYAVLFAVIGTINGTGDGVTTFNLPDGRGRTFAGVDNMGGSAANRITNAIAGFDGTVLGASGGSQSMQSHTHVATDSGHVHGPGSGGTFINGAGSGIGISGGAGGSQSILTASATANVTNAVTGAGNSQNIQPTMMANLFIKT